MADELKSLDEAIVKIKGMLPIFQAFADMQKVLEYVSNNKGMIAGHASEMQKMAQDRKEMQSTLDIVKGSLAQTQTKLAEVDAIYKTKLSETQHSYAQASVEARNKYLGERDRYIAEAEAAKRELGETKNQLQTEVSNLSKLLDALKGEYETLRVKFR